ncbi:fasciclin domain-containing protein [Sphingomonas donggukensis]|uniref:Fasciclin domain-containing protein n=1 Tax=Sphingomonas donggukensis TaxID=2949093 RepID=A0ABY4TX01_9SPHN|nr:fasciclin domain-containing protein [Sphingomonas donggukensis]URW74833.1 fasciclin domain-containing protein [Sphingomonas donggukensis]
MRKRALLLAAMIVATTAGCDRTDTGGNASNASATAPASESLAAALGNADDLGTAAGLAKSAGLERMLDGVAAYTIFAPVDGAFSSLPDDRRKALDGADGRPQLIALLRAHIASGYVSRADLDAGLAAKDGSAKLATVSGSPLTIRKQGDAILVGDGDSAARVVGTPIVARNGVIYRIDRVIPPSGTSR